MKYLDDTALSRIYAPLSNSRKNTLANGMIELNYIVQLVSSEKFYEYLIISVPNEKNLANEIQNGKFVAHIVMDENNNTFFESDIAQEFVPKIFPKKDFCSSGIFKMDNIKFINASPSSIVMFKPEANMSIDVICPEEVLSKKKLLLLHSSNVGLKLITKHCIITK